MDSQNYDKEVTMIKVCKVAEKIFYREKDAKKHAYLTYGAGAKYTLYIGVMQNNEAVFNDKKELLTKVI